MYLVQIEEYSSGVVLSISYQNVVQMSTAIQMLLQMEFKDRCDCNHAPYPGKSTKFFHSTCTMYIAHLPPE